MSPSYLFVNHDSTSINRNHQRPTSEVVSYIQRGVQRKKRNQSLAKLKASRKSPLPSPKAMGPNDLPYYEAMTKPYFSTVDPPHSNTQSLPTPNSSRLNSPDSNDQEIIPSFHLEELDIDFDDDVGIEESPGPTSQTLLSPDQTLLPARLSNSANPDCRIITTAHFPSLSPSPSTYLNPSSQDLFSSSLTTITPAVNRLLHYLIYTLPSY